MYYPEESLRGDRRGWAYPFWYPISKLVSAAFWVHFRYSATSQFFGLAFTRSEAGPKNCQVLRPRLPRFAARRPAFG
jgi:hypothetical protein